MHHFISYHVVYILQNVLITSSGAWKLAGFGFAISTDNTTGDTANSQAFHYAVSGISLKSMRRWIFNLILPTLYKFDSLIPERFFVFIFCTDLHI